MEPIRKILVSANILLLLLSIFLLVGLTTSSLPTGKAALELKGNAVGKGSVAIDLDTGEGVSTEDLIVLVPVGILILAFAFLVFALGAKAYRHASP